MSQSQLTFLLSDQSSDVDLLNLQNAVETNRIFGWCVTDNKWKQSVKLCWLPVMCASAWPAMGSLQDFSTREWQPRQFWCPMQGNIPQLCCSTTLQHCRKKEDNTWAAAQLLIMISYFRCEWQPRKLSCSLQCKIPHLCWITLKKKSSWSASFLDMSCRSSADNSTTQIGFFHLKFSSHVLVLSDVVSSWGKGFNYFLAGCFEVKPRNEVNQIWSWSWSSGELQQQHVQQSKLAQTTAAAGEKKGCMKQKRFFKWRNAISLLQRSLQEMRPCPTFHVSSTEQTSIFRLWWWQWVFLFDVFTAKIKRVLFQFLDVSDQRLTTIPPLIFFALSRADDCCRHCYFSLQR